MVAVAFVGTIWCLAGTALGLGVWRDLDAQAARCTIDVVVREYSSEASLSTMVSDLRRRGIVSSAQLMNSDDVWTDFARDLQIRSQDLRDVAHVPAIVRVRLQPASLDRRTVESFITSVRTTYPESVETIVWPESYVDMIERGRRSLVVFGGAALLLSLVLFVVAVSYAFRAEIHRAGADLRVADLMGATPTWIAMPHLIVSLLSGVAGLILGVGLAVGVRAPAIMHAPWLQTVRIEEILLAAAAVAVLGLLLSWRQSVRAVTRAVRLR
jgi:cell division protein FtsX